MSPDQIEEAEIAIGKAVDRVFIDSTGKAEPVYDGVVDPAFYCQASSRILWILKEPWDEDDCSGGGWSITKDLIKSQTAKMAKGPTFQPIIYATYGILNQVWAYDDMKFIRDDPAMAQVLHSIAYMNVKKLPGLKRSNDGEILSAYAASKEVTLQQIAAYKPDFVIGCRPHMAAIIADIGIAGSDLESNESARWATKDGTTFIEVYHPAQTTITRERYVDDILAIARTRLNSPAKS